MNNLNKITKILGATFVLVASTQAYAAKSVISSADVTVQNIFNVVEVSALTFGTIRANADPSGVVANVASLAINSNGTAAVTAGANNAAITALVAGAPGSYTIDSAAPFTDLTITFPAANIKLVNGTAPPSSAEFTINSASWEALVNSGANTGNAYVAATPNLQTDASGNAAFTVGAALDTESAAVTDRKSVV